MLRKGIQSTVYIFKGIDRYGIVIGTRAKYHTQYTVDVNHETEIRIFIRLLNLIFTSNR